MKYCWEPLQSASQTIILYNGFRNYPIASTNNLNNAHINTYRKKKHAKVGHWMLRFFFLNINFEESTMRESKVILWCVVSVVFDFVFGIFMSVVCTIFLFGILGVCFKYRMPIDFKLPSHTKQNKKLLTFKLY